MKAINIQWDTDGECIYLPTEIKIPDALAENYEYGDDGDEISDYITYATGFCHFGFDIVE